MKNNQRKWHARYKKVLILRDDKKHTFGEIADILDVSRTRAFQLYRLAIKWRMENDH